MLSVHTNTVFLLVIIFPRCLLLVWFGENKYHKCVRTSVLNILYYEVFQRNFSIIVMSSSSSSSTKPLLQHYLAFENLFIIIDFHLKFNFIYLVQKQNGVLGVTGCVFYVIICTSVKALAENDSYYILNDFSNISILLV